MKKTLLISLIALSAVAANAQQVTKARTDMKPATVKTPAMSITKAPEAKAFDKNLGELVKTNVRKANPNAKLIAPTVGKEVRDPNFKQKRVATRRAGTLQDYYIASGNDYFESASISWTMSQTTVTSEDKGEQPALHEVIPNAFSNVFPEGIDVTYSIVTSGTSTIVKIPAQYIGVTSTYTDGTIAYYWFLDDLYSTSNDGAINLTLNDNGSLTVPDGAYIAFSAFTTNAFDPSLTSTRNGGTFAGSRRIITKAQYLTPSQMTAPAAMYEPLGVFLHAGINAGHAGQGDLATRSFSNNLMLMPAKAPTTFTDTTMDPANNYSWSISQSVYNSETEKYDDGETTTSTDKDFEFTPVAGNVYKTPVFYAGYDDMQSDPYQWGLVGEEEDEETGELVKNYENTLIYAGNTAWEYSSSGTDYGQAVMTRCNPDNGIAYYGATGTPGINTQNYELIDLYIYQGKPTAPIFFTGVNMYVRNFQAKEGFNIHCKLVKCERTGANLEIGDVIAEADLTDVDDVITRESNGITVALLQWKEFYVEDEDGLPISVDHLFIDDEFMVVIEGWNNGTFECFPMGEYDYNENGFTNTWFTMEDDGEIKTYHWTNQYTHLYVGLIDAAYGYIETESDTDVTIDAAGGQATVKVSNAMLRSVNSSTGAYTPRIFIEDVEAEDIDDETGLPTWLTIKVGNANEEATAFDIIFEAEALPEGTEGREAKVTFYQEGALLETTITQGTVTGISTVTKAVKVNNAAPAYNLAGQRVAGDFKGLVIKNGAKFMNK